MQIILTFNPGKHKPVNYVTFFRNFINPEYVSTVSLMSVVKGLWYVLG